MIALFMGMLAKECYPKFKEGMKSHFQDKTDWKVIYNYKSNIIRIWQKIAEYENVPFVRVIQYQIMDKTFFIGITLILVVLFSLAFLCFISNFDWLNDYLLRWHVIEILVVMILFYSIPIYNIYRIRRKKEEKFENMKDLIRGTVTADIGQLFLAYQHFKQMPNIRIVNMK